MRSILVVVPAPALDDHPGLEAPGARFLVDRLEEGGPILASVCSGHGFKHSAALGEALAAWALSGVRPAVLESFAASRFAAG